MPNLACLLRRPANASHPFIGLLPVAAVIALVGAASMIVTAVLGYQLMGHLVFSVPLAWSARSGGCWWAFGGICAGS